MLSILKALDETSLVVENVFVLGFVKVGIYPPKALIDAFTVQGDAILKALNREDESCINSAQDIMDFLFDSDQDGHLIEFSAPTAKDLCFDDDGELLGYSNDLTTKISTFFYAETFEDCVAKAACWYNDYINEQIATLR